MANFCTQSISNTGESSCRVLISKAKGFVFMSMVDSSGVTPSLDPLVDVVNNTFVNTKINAANRLDRWFPVNGIRVSEDVRADDEYFTYPDGTREFLRQGARTVVATRGSGTPQFVKKVKTWGTFNGGFFIIDENDKLVGVENSLGKLEPIPFEDNTFNAKLITGNDTQKFSTAVMTFDYSSLVSDGDLMVWNTDADVSLKNKDGLLDINVVTGATSTTTLGLTIDTGSGYINDLVPQEGLITVDFTVINLTTALPVVVVATEPTAGNYVLTFAAQTLTDVLEVTIAKTGIETNVSTHTL
jgi:hypothetical protein